MYPPVTQNSPHCHIPPLVKILPEQNRRQILINENKQSYRASAYGKYSMFFVYWQNLTPNFPVLKPEKGSQICFLNGCRWPSWIFHWPYIRSPHSNLHTKLKKNVCFWNLEQIQTNLQCGLINKISENRFVVAILDFRCLPNSILMACPHTYQHSHPIWRQPALFCCHHGDQQAN